MKRKIQLPKTELQQVKDLCKVQGFDYDETPLNAEYDPQGNILSLDFNPLTKKSVGTQEELNKLLDQQNKLRGILLGKGFE